MEFDATDFDDLFDPPGEEAATTTATAVAEPPPEVKPAPVAAAVPQSLAGLVFDIETGPRPWAEIEQFYDGPAKLPPFDESMVKYGVTKDPVKRQEKLLAVKLDYEARLAREGEAAEAHRQEFLGQAVLSPVTGQVLAIGYQAGAAGVPLCDGVFGCGEKVILARFWERYQDCRRRRIPMIGFNICNFDLPFLVRRSWLHGVDVPSGLLAQGRYWDKIFVDLMQVWGCGVWGDRISLDKLCGFFGLTRKTGSGADFARLYANDATRGAALDYLENDLRMTTEAAVKLGVL